MGALRRDDNPRLAGGLHRRPDGPAPRMAEHDHELGSGHCAGKLHAAEHLIRGDVAGDTDTEDVAEAEIEEQFRG